MTSSKSCFYYVHDPMCSWCWAHLPEWQKLEAHLSKLLPVQYVLGGLAPDSDVPMPIEQQQAICGYWKKINHLIGTEFNFDFWSTNTPRRSTYPACRAVLAASWQNALHEMNIALQEAYYLKAMNPSNIDTHLILAKQLGLNVRQFSDDLSSEKLENEFNQQLALARRLPIQGFPAMVLSHQGDYYPIVLDYKDHSSALVQVKKILAS
ncbi:MAG: putative protein-disulfide isomerase [Sphingobacteriales bacterium]|jgi:putative protein-disulfide isomerase